MIITKEFLFLNFPKTGSTFIRTVLKEIYPIKRANLLKKILVKLRISSYKIEELYLPNIRMNVNQPDQHGTFDQIPKKHRKKKKYSIIRNPYDRFLSDFRYRAWVGYPYFDHTNIKTLFPSYPNLTIIEFCDYYSLWANERAKVATGLTICPENLKNMGNQTMQFIQMFFKNPKHILLNFSEEYIYSGLYKNDIGDIEFIAQENLTEEFCKILNKFNFSEENIELAKNHKKVNVSKKDKKDYDWEPEVLVYVQEKEKYLFKILEDYGFNYTEPTKF